MSGFLKTHVALFYDSSGSFVGSKRICTSFSIGIKQKTFNFNKGTYNVKPFVSRSRVTPFPYFFSDYYFYVYQLNNPDPVQLDEKCLPSFNAFIYRDLLESNLVNDLNKSRRNTFGNLLTPRNILIVVIVLGIVYYFSSGGTLK